MTTETTGTAKKNYKDTLNLPQTAFAMEAKLVQNEPARLKKWQDLKLYDQLMKARQGAERWVLHDGPPFANGDIHIGHLINKTLKDVIMRFRSMQGKQTPYVPGWDCHGLPIEHKIQEDFQKKLGAAKFRELSALEVRKACYEYAEKYARIQSEQFQRLGILGEWERPYLTMTPDYEASTLEVFARFVEAGLVYKKLKPVPWSVSNQTALADAELEYKDVEDPSVYVEFPVADPQMLRRMFQEREKDSAPWHTNDGSSIPSYWEWESDLEVFFIAWTTTPWTLPANLAIAAHPDINYAAVKYQRNGKTRIGIVAVDLISAVFAKTHGTVENFLYVASVPGRALVEAQAVYKHPFVGREGRIVAADYVTTTDGTGLVHTAPGHGEDDYETGIREGLPVYSPVLANGRFDETVPEWLHGLTVWEGNPIITQRLRDLGVLLHEVRIVHSYPHDWRSKKPIIFRATEQWFVAMDRPIAGDSLTLREGALFCTDDRMKAFEQVRARNGVTPRAEEMLRETFNDPAAELRGTYLVKRTGDQAPVQFIPGWGRNRLQGMLESRPDWCISRQRAWGLPIPVFYNEKGEALLTPQSVRAVAKRFAQKGSDAWFTDSPVELLGDYDPGPKFPKDKLRKEQDIFDVWFESGSSWNAVLRGRDYLKFPADMYLEGSDQHRGWFQLSLLPALGATGRPPFKSVLTHGFAVKPDGTKVSKSDKEYVTATKEIDTHGADVLRLWVCSVDYQNDMPTSPQTIKEFGDKYRKIRNTLRYLLSNLYDYEPKRHAQEVPFSSLDGWALAELDHLIVEVTAAYDQYQMHRVFRLLHDFCAVQISAVYGNAMKDRLYTEACDSPLRRRSQTVMHRMVVALTKLLAPILMFTADEAWEHIRHKPVGEENLASVHLALLPVAAKMDVPDERREDWKILMDLRDSALMQLDQLKKQVGLNKALEAEVIYQVDDDVMRRRLQAFGADLEDIVGAGYHSFAEKGPEGPAVTVKVVDRRETYKACARSWKRRPDVGGDPEFPDLTVRDAQAVRKSSKQG